MVEGGGGREFFFLVKEWEVRGGRREERVRERRGEGGEGRWGGWEEGEGEKEDWERGGEVREERETEEEERRRSV